VKKSYRKNHIYFFAERTASEQILADNITNQKQNGAR
jgi:hypothetical protein